MCQCCELPTSCGCMARPVIGNGCCHVQEEVLAALSARCHQALAEEPATLLVVAGGVRTVQ
jgi:tRNA A37 threonylcarbamoyltransferase TsaD